jgi:magnesium transporter
VGFFGQNFDVLSGKGFYYSMWVMIVLFPIALLFWFRHKRWF